MLREQLNTYGVGLQIGLLVWSGEGVGAGGGGVAGPFG